MIVAYCLADEFSASARQLEFLMTIGMAWVGTRRDGRRHLYVASDSRVTGGARFDACPKILLLPRSDCLLAFAGVTAATYPLMLQVSYAIGAHQPSRDRSIDILSLKAHLLRVLTDFVEKIREPAMPFSSRDAQFLLAGYSWRAADYRIWNVSYSDASHRFIAREAGNFHPKLLQAAFIGDWSNRVRSKVHDALRASELPHAYLEPFRVLSSVLEESQMKDSIGGPPQLARVSQHMNSRPICVKWHGDDTLLGRPLFDYENVDYWSIDPITCKFFRPRSFGFRGEPQDEGVDGEE
jgi:hypothetical protein